MAQLDQLTDILIEFRDKRDWSKFHKPEALSRALMVEAAELNRLFLWGSRPDQEAISDEISDTLIFLLYLCHATGIDLEQAVLNKIHKNAERYPIDKDHASERGWQAELGTNTL